MIFDFFDTATNRKRRTNGWSRFEKEGTKGDKKRAKAIEDLNKLEQERKELLMKGTVQELDGIDKIDKLRKKKGQTTTTVGGQVQPTDLQSGRLVAKDLLDIYEAPKDVSRCVEKTQ